jgi:hypothetical protein
LGNPALWLVGKFGLAAADLFSRTKLSEDIVSGEKKNEMEIIQPAAG